MPPTPADVIEQINAIQESNEPTDEELWAVYTKAIRETANQIYYFQFTALDRNGKTQGQNARDKVTAIWNNLPEKIQKYVGSKGEFMRIADNYDDEELKFERTRFLKTMPTIKKRMEYAETKLLLEKEKLFIE